MKYSDYKKQMKIACKSFSFIKYMKFIILWNVLYRHKYYYRIINLYKGLKGIIWCRRFHKPLLDSSYSYNGTDWKGKKHRGEMRQKRCIVCGNNWIIREDQKPLTWAQCDTGMKMFGNMWVGPKTYNEFYKQKIKNV